MPKQADFGLAETISRIKAELIRSQEVSAAKELPNMFRVSNVSVQIQFVIKEQKDASGGFDIKLFAIKATDSVQTEHVHSVTINMSALERVQHGLLQDQDSQ